MAAMPADWKLAEAVFTASPLTKNPRIMLWGPPGTGKSFAAMNYGRSNEDIVRIECFGDMNVASILWHFMPMGDAFMPFLGPLPTAMTLGKRLVIDEADKAPGEVMDILRQATAKDDVASLTIPDPDLFTGAVSREDMAAIMAAGDHMRTYRPVPGYEVVWTQNDDPADLEEPIQDRFPVKIKIENVHPAAIAALPEDLRSTARNTALAEGSRRVGIRAWSTFADLREHIGEDMAAQAIFADRAGDVMDALRLGRPKDAAPKVKPEAKVKPADAPVPADGKLPTMFLRKTGEAGKPPRVRCANCDGPRDHLKMHHAAEGRDGLTCKRCGTVAASPGEYYVKVKRGDDEPWTCRGCGSTKCSDPTHAAPKSVGLPF
jgi:hypothetical protein